MPIIMLLFGIFPLVGQIIVDEIYVEGNKRTKEHIITRELPLKKNISYEKDEFDSLMQLGEELIYNTRLFFSVDMESKKKENNRYRLLINVRERWYIYPVPIFKLIDVNFNDWWHNRGRDLSRVNIGLKLIDYNFRGKSEILNLTAQFGVIEFFGFSYYVPYIDKEQKHGITLTTGFFRSKNMQFSTQEDSLVFFSSRKYISDKSSVYLMYRYRPNLFSYHSFFLGFFTEHTADIISKLNPDYLGLNRFKQKYFNVGYIYNRIKVDNLGYSKKGKKISLRVQKYGLGIFDDLDFWAFRLNFSRFSQLFEKVYYAFNVGTLISTHTEDHVFANIFALGYKGDKLRGYELKVIPGGNIFTQKNEIKYHLFSNIFNINKIMPIKEFQLFPVNIYGKVFFDHGYVVGYFKRRKNSHLSNRYLYSIGVGLDFVFIYDLTFRLEYSQNSLNENHLFLNLGFDF